MRKQKLMSGCTGADGELRDLPGKREMCDMRKRVGWFVAVLGLFSLAAAASTELSSSQKALT
jgi:hypothetical protein